jgi:hypothetical protein
MEHDQVKDPNTMNGNKTKRVEALTVGLIPALSLVVAAFVTAVSMVGMYFSLKSEIRDLKTMVIVGYTDQWTRSMMVDWCRQMERANSGFRCPPTLERYRLPTNVLKQK